MPPELLDARAQVIQGKPRYLSMVAGVELKVDGVCMIGYHSRAQGRGILAHTINSFAFARVRLNGQEVSEMDLYGALAGAYGAPVIAASGDDVFIAEHQSTFPQTQFVQVKRATGFSSGVSLSPERACQPIREGVAQAGLRAMQVDPLRIHGPITVDLLAQTPSLAELFCQWPTLERTDGDALRFTAPDIESAVRMLNCLSAMSSMLR